MSMWSKIKIENDIGEEVEAVAPEIISASRATDIPAFYSDWFFCRLCKGFSGWTNPYNGKKTYVSYAKTRLIVFWSKNPKPLLAYLDYLREIHINCYIQFTLNDYVSEGLEPGVPAVAERIETFKRLVEKLGVGKVIWRFDPLILSDMISVDHLLNKAEFIGNELKGYTEKMVFSFADIEIYKKVKGNLFRNGIKYREFTEADMVHFAEGISKMNQKWNYELATCAEKIDLTQFGIIHNKCIDDDLMIRFFHDDCKLMQFLEVNIVDGDLFHHGPQNNKKRNNKDKGQRPNCGCIVSKDIGAYNTCPHLCAYCYANASKENVIKNWGKHLSAMYEDSIVEM